MKTFNSTAANAFNFGNVTATINVDEATICIKDGGVYLERKLQKQCSPEELAKVTIEAIWDLYHRSEKNPDKRVKLFEAATGLYPCSVERLLVRSARAKRSGEVAWTFGKGAVIFTIAPGCSKGYKNPVIENREYNITSLYNKLVKIFSC